jgi:hypothetical protein
MLTGDVGLHQQRLAQVKPSTFGADGKRKMKYSNYMHELKYTQATSRRIAAQPDISESRIRIGEQLDKVRLEPAARFGRGLERVG